MGFFDVSERWAENYSGRIAVEESNHLSGNGRSNQESYRILSGLAI